MAANPGASSAEPPAARVRSRLRNPVAACLIALAATGLVPDAHPAQPPGDAAAELAASGRLDAALTLLDGWLAEHPGDARLFPVVLQVVTAAPEQRTVDAVLKRYGSALAADSVGVLRAVPADWAELRGGVEDALDELRRSRLPDSGRREAVLLLELGQIGDETAPRETPIAVHAGLARAGHGLDDRALERSLREAFAAAGQAGGGADGAVAGYGLVALLSATGRSSEALTVLAELGRRFPRSPEYALAAVELRGGSAGGGAGSTVVAMPSAAMLLGSAVLDCPAPCTIPKAVLSGPSTRHTPRATPMPARPATAPAVAAAAPRAVEPTAAPARTAAPVPAERSRQPAAAQATRVPPSGQTERQRRPQLVEPVPAPVPARADGVPEPGEPPAAPGAAPATASEEGRRRGGGQAVALRTATPAPPPVTVRITAQAARSAAKQAAERLPVIEEAPVRPTAAAAPQPEAAPRASASAGGTRIRVTAQPANRPALSADRVFVPATPREDAAVQVRPGQRTALPAKSAPASTSTSPSAVRVASTPDPAAFVVQVGAYVDPDNALAMELQLRQAGFSAIARSYRDPDGSIVHRVGVGGNVTRAKAEQVLAQLRGAGFNGYLSRRDVVSYLPPARRRR